ncbi:hypothetical protein PFISCL1PPCAC_1995, partial [Pristionchus fissidentatus]
QYLPMQFLVLLFLIPLVSSRSISNETSIDELDSLPSNQTSIDDSSLLESNDTTLVASLAMKVREAELRWAPWWEEKKEQMEELKEVVDVWRVEHTSLVVYITIGMAVGLLILSIIIVIRCLTARLRRRKIGQLGGDAISRKKLMTEDTEEM